MARVSTLMEVSFPLWETQPFPAVPCRPEVLSDRAGAHPNR